MDRNKQIICCVLLLLFGLTGFILQVFTFEFPDGIFGFLFCLMCVYFIIGSIIKLGKLSDKWKNAFFEIFDLLFFIR